MRVSRSLVLAAALAVGACATMMGGPGDVGRARALTDQLMSEPDLMYVSASVRGDSVYLSGWVPNYPQRHKAEAMASKVPGIHHVYDATGVGANDHGPRS
jgi:osmotically-inducible protein OsmY